MSLMSAVSKALTNMLFCNSMNKRGSWISKGQQSDVKMFLAESSCLCAVILTFFIPRLVTKYHLHSLLLENPCQIPLSIKTGSTHHKNFCSVWPLLPGKHYSLCYPMSFQTWPNLTLDQAWKQLLDLCGLWPTCLFVLQWRKLTFSWYVPFNYNINSSCVNR